jgi:hypothetical protein
MMAARHAGQMLGFVLAQALFGLCVASGLILMAAMNLGAHGPSLAEFLVQTWPLTAASILAGAALVAIVRGHALAGALALLFGAAALAWLWRTTLA